MAAEIKKEFGIQPDLIKGRDGVFEVTVGNEKIFSKRDEGRFPEEREVLDALREVEESRAN